MGNLSETPVPQEDNGCVNPTADVARTHVFSSHNTRRQGFGYLIRMEAY